MLGMIVRLTKGLFAWLRKVFRPPVPTLDDFIKNSGADTTGEIVTIKIAEKKPEEITIKLEIEPDIEAGEPILFKNKLKIYELKKKYENIFVTNIMGEEFVFRPLTKNEYLELVINNPGIPGYILAEKICSLCTLIPEDYNFANPSHAGIPDTLFNEIRHYSGFTNADFIKEIAKEYRNRTTNDFDFQMENIIMVAFPGIKPEDMKDWDIYKTLDYYTRAEWIIENLMVTHRLPWTQQQVADDSHQVFHATSTKGMGSNFPATK